MFKNPTPQPEIDDETRETSRKREVTALIAMAVVTVGLGIVSGRAIEKAGKKVHDRIAPPKKTTEDE